MKRRQLMAKLAQWAGALGLGALLPTRGEARRLPVPQDEVRHLPVPSQLVHWVSLDRRHIAAQLIHGSKTGLATVQVTRRPPVRLSNGSVVTTTQLIEGVREMPYDPREQPRPNTWHYPEPAGCARPPKPYAEWWYRENETDGHGPLTAKPAPWHVKTEGDEAALFAHLHGPDNELLAYRIDDADSNHARTVRETKLYAELLQRAGEQS